MQHFHAKDFLSYLYFILLLQPACGYIFDRNDWPEQDVAGRKLTPSIALCKSEARAVLKKFCGECHQRSISKAPKALQIYDLEEDIWYGRLSKSQLKGLRSRIGRAKGITGSEVRIVRACVDCLLATECH